MSKDERVFWLILIENDLFVLQQRVWYHMDLSDRKRQLVMEYIVAKVRYKSVLNHTVLLAQLNRNQLSEFWHWYMMTISDKGVDFKRKWQE